jgi:hypothetical protein
MLTPHPPAEDFLNLPGPTPLKITANLTCRLKRLIPALQEAFCF